MYFPGRILAQDSAVIAEKDVYYFTWQGESLMSL